MSPNTKRKTVFISNGSEKECLDELKKDSSELKPYKRTIAWRNVLAMLTLHCISIFMFFYGLIAQDGKLWSLHWFWFIIIFSGFGVLAGAHRLWAHRSYKAKLPLRILLMIMNTVAMQNDIYEWSRDHRVHHKYSETDADPHNSNRGFFFSHVGWLLVSKHPDVKAKGKSVDLSDIWADPVIRFQRRFYIPLCFIFWFFIPVMVPVYFWNEKPWYAFSANVFRYVFSLHMTWLVNSAAHLKGNRPYDKTIGPRENYKVVIATWGEGYHNYHHTFPWDYSASELGWQQNFNLATAFIDFMAYIGQAYDLKKPPPEMVQKRKERTGQLPDLETGKRSYVRDHMRALLLMFWPQTIVIILLTIYTIIYGTHDAMIYFKSLH